jgi:hypothetical protein
VLIYAPGPDSTRCARPVSLVLDVQLDDPVLVYFCEDRGPLMQVRFKRFDVIQEVKNNGVEIEVRTPDDKRQLGDLVITKTKVIWCPGKTTQANGITLTWEQFIEMMESQKS